MLALVAIVLASAGTTTMSFEPFPGVRLGGSPVPDKSKQFMVWVWVWIPSYSFCTWRKEDLIELGWKRLLTLE